MGYRKFIVPVFDPLSMGRRFDHNELVDAEGVAGVYVHRARGTLPQDRRWRVATAAGYSMYQFRIDTRRFAREVARTLGPLVHARANSGEWTGEQWEAHDPEGVRKFKDAVERLAASPGRA